MGTIPVEPLNTPSRSSYPLLEFPPNVMVKYVSTYQEIEDISTEFLRKGIEQVIGLDCDLPVNPRPRQQEKLITIRIADIDDAAVCCVGRLDRLPSSLCKVFEMESIKKVSRKVDGDLKKIEQDFRIKCKGGLELGAFCRSQGVIDDGRLVLKNYKHNLSSGTYISFHPGGYICEAAAYSEVAEQTDKLDSALVKAHDKCLRNLGSTLLFDAIVQVSELCTSKQVSVGQLVLYNLTSVNKSQIFGDEMIGTCDSDDSDSIKSDVEDNHDIDKELAYIDDEGNDRLITKDIDKECQAVWPATV
ncbi:hypothetical protein BDA99DRAFT_541448 [Phascolomyces articulosus]|uniref:Uncharacterized protein n=1 Tax=Phascolomyces articulosus TaxID=60185 RepID=A0AAD5K1X7_9FUNG|nr:hypothetical protein BDA99DRAFT_541448 [Phascolomyces articulosus]